MTRLRSQQLRWKHLHPRDDPRRLHRRPSVQSGWRPPTSTGTARVEFRHDTYRRDRFAENHFVRPQLLLPWCTDTRARRRLNRPWIRAHFANDWLDSLEPRAISSRLPSARSACFSTQALLQRLCRPIRTATTGFFWPFPRCCSSLFSSRDCKNCVKSINRSLPSPSIS